MSLVFVGMSGGVDSSVTALLLKEQGYDVRGITLVFSNIDGERKCCALDEIKYALYVCKYLGIQHEFINVKDLFKMKIINPFIQEYLQGRTPNPCVNCNFHFKFGYMLEYAISQGADFIATGHYARIIDVGSGKLLYKGVDSNKDQSYFLARLNKFQISKSLLPLGNLTKDEVQKIAKESKLPLKPHLRESQDLCFVPNNDIKNFLIQNNVLPSRGDVIDESGNFVSNHDGVYFYTIGQRQGLNVQLGKKVYVKYKDVKNNRIIVSENPYFSGFYGSKLNWIWHEQPKDGEFTVKIRYKSNGVMCGLKLLDSDKVEVRFYEKQFGVTPGQLAVFYNGDCVVGSAFIEETF
jgi:tRNA-specific 2-thiouridylase